MQALILAAGCGKRLRPLTDHLPKSLVEVCGKPLLINALDCLSDRGISEVIIVVGDKKDMIIQRIGFQYNGMKIIYVDNPRYLETNNVYSFWLARNYIHDDVIMLECDLYYRRFLIDKMLTGEGEANILVSPFNKETMEGTVITADQDKRALFLIIGRDQYPRYDYTDKLKTVNVYFFRKEFICNNYFPLVDVYIQRQQVNSYYELVLGGLIYWKNNDIRIVEIDAKEWCEIDCLADLQLAEEKFRGK